MTPELKQKLAEGRERARQLRAQGLLPPITRRSKRKSSAPRREYAPSAAAAPVTDLTQTPEFKEAVAAAASLIMAQLSVARQTSAAPGVGPQDRGWATELAMQIAELTDQGSGMQRTPPEIIKVRKAADTRMRGLIVAARAKGEIPIYQLIAKTVLPIEGYGETLIEPLQRGPDNRVYPTKIRWATVPNLAMEPVNAVARDIMAAFRESIGNMAPAEIGVETNLSLTDQGHVVVDGGIQQRKDRSSERSNLGALVINEDGAVIPNGGGPAYIDVAVLGTIAPPVRQNG